MRKFVSKFGCYFKNGETGYYRTFFSIILSLIVVISCSSSSSSTGTEPPVSSSQKQLVVVGGGEPKEEIRSSLLELSSVPNPKVLIIPQAAREETLESVAQRNVDIFKDLGVEQIMVLDLAYVDQALDSIVASDVIWMSGGSQSRLMSVLEERAQGVVLNAIREKSESGAPIGGSSAGAAIMSEVMITSSYRDEDTGLLTPRISEGLGLWPEVIVDQHFSERNRLERLEIAVQKHSDLIGVGIDERTAVIYDEKQNRFQVTGAGTVTILRATDSTSGSTELEKTILEPGDSFDLENTSTS